MASSKTLRVKSISELHRILGLPKPEHPLISILDYGKVEPPPEDFPFTGATFDFYQISMKRDTNGKLLYGQQEYDFDEGIMFFMAPNQLLRNPNQKPADDRSGWIMLIHPDFLWNTPLAKAIRQYEFFGYSVNEALFLSEKEENIINGIVQNIQQEYRANIDHFSQNIIISHLETLLNYADRFYNRQFITRKVSNHRILDQLEKVLSDYLNSDDLMKKGLPSVQYISEQLNISTNYLRSLLKNLTGQSTQQYIHEKLIDKAKEKLSTTDLSISEIAYQLGFEHSQSFSKLFKAKTQLSPLEFRQSFN